MHDHYEHAFHPPPCCPSCGAAMRFVSSIQTFECRACEVWIAEARKPKISEMAAHPADNGLRVRACAIAQTLRYGVKRRVSAASLS
jgi:hypothetical protein